MRLPHYGTSPKICNDKTNGFTTQCFWVGGGSYEVMFPEAANLAREAKTLSDQSVACSKPAMGKRVCADSAQKPLVLPITGLRGPGSGGGGAGSRRVLHNNLRHGHDAMKPPLITARPIPCMSLKNCKFDGTSLSSSSFDHVCVLTDNFSFSCLHIKGSGNWFFTVNNQTFSRRKKTHHCFSTVGVCTKSVQNKGPFTPSVSVN